MRFSKTKPLSKQLNLSYPLRTYLDDGSHEFNSTGIEEKVDTLARLVNEGIDLYQILKHYKHSYRLPGYQHIKDNAAHTIKGYISYLVTKRSYDWQTISALDGASDQEITKLLTELLKEFILKNYNAASFVLSYIDYKYHGKEEEYKRISKVLNMDFDTGDREVKYLMKTHSDEYGEDDSLEKLYKERDESLQWDYMYLFGFFSNIVLPDLGENEVRSLDHEEIKNYSKGISYFINKHYPKDKMDRINFDSEFRKSRTLKLAIDLVEVLYFDKPMFDYNVFHIKNEFMRVGFLEELFENDQAALLVQDDFRDVEDNAEAKADEVFRNNKLRFVKLWDHLNASLRQKDSLIIASYRGYADVKIGLMPKGSRIVSDPENPIYKILQLTNAKEFFKTKHIILDRLTRSRPMLNKVDVKKDYIISKYVGKEVLITYDNLSSYSIKLMCMEWLRTEFAPKRYRLQYLTKVSRKEITNVDIYGLTENNRIVAAQVIFKNDYQIHQKGLQKFQDNSSLLKLVFSEVEIDSPLPVYKTRAIFDQLYNSRHKFFINNLVGD
jgi:hypothetical protein